MNSKIVHSMMIVLTILTIQWYQRVESKSKTPLKLPKIGNRSTGEFNLTLGVGVMNDVNEIVDHPPIKCSTTIAIIVCETKKYPDPTKAKHNSFLEAFDQQISQTIVLLKSIALTHRLRPNRGQSNEENCVSVKILSNKPDIVDNIWDIIKNEEEWDEEFIQVLRLTYVPAIYPAGYEWMTGAHRACSTVRLFLDTVLKDDDLIIYTDTDFIFFKSPQYLWKEFTNFEPETVAGLVPKTSIKMYGRSNFNPTSYNGGVILMNLTRMREIRWTHRMEILSAMYMHQAQCPCQEVLINYFNRFPTQLIDLPCHWNFVKRDCRQATICAKDGISGLHGTNGEFFLKNCPYSTIFESFRELSLRHGFSLENFISKSEAALSIQHSTRCRHCKKLKRFSNPILKSLRLLQSIKNNENLSHQSITQSVLPSVPLILIPQPEHVVMGTKKKTLGMASKHEDCVQLAIPFCEGNDIQIGSPLFNLTLGLLKSMALIQNENPQSQCTHITVISPKRKNFDRLSQVMKSWDPKFKQYMRLTFVKSSYPPEFDWMNSKYECGMLPFFYPELLSSYDSVIHLDPNSFQFNPSPNDLWKQFKLFTQNSIVGISQSCEPSRPVKEMSNGKFNLTHKWQPEFMLMNLTRMREVGFATKVLMITTIHKAQIVSPVQDVLRIYFTYLPQHVSFIPYENKGNKFSLTSCEAPELY